MVNQPSQESVNSYINEGLSPQEALAYATDEVNSTGAFTPATEPVINTGNPIINKEVLQTEATRLKPNAASAQTISKIERVEQAKVAKSSNFGGKEKDVTVTEEPIAGEDQITIDPANMPTSIEEFDELYPDAAGPDRGQFALALEAADLEEKRSGIRTKNVRERDRLRNEVISDTLLSAGGKFTLATGSVAYAAADLASRISPVRNLLNALVSEEDKIPSLDEALGLAGNFSESRKILDAELSDPTKYSKEDAARASALRRSGKADRIAALEEEGYSNIAARTLDEARDIAYSAQDLIDNPLALSDTALETAPLFLLTGGAGSLAIKTVQKSITAKTTEAAGKRFLASKAGKAVVEKAATRAGITTGAAYEGLSVGINAKAKVLDTPFDKLAEGSPEYNELVKSGKSEEEARFIISNKVSDFVTVATGLTGAAFSKITGAGNFEGNLFNKDAYFGNLVNRFTQAALNVGKETVEETLQEGTSTVSANIATKTYVDETQKIEEGSGDAAGAGGISGGVTASAFVAPTLTVSTIRDLVSPTVSGAKKALGNKAKEKFIKQTADALTPEQKAAKTAAVESGDLSNILDDTAEDFSLNTALTTLVERGATQALTSEERELNLNKARELVGKEYAKGQQLKKDVDTLYVEIGDAAPTKEQSTKLTELEDVQGKSQANLMAAFTLMTALTEQGTLSKTDINQQIKAVDKGTEEEAVAAATEIRRSFRADPSSITVKQAENVLSRAGDKLPPEVVQEYSDHIETRKAVDDLLKTENGVANDIVVGGKGFKGVNQYLTAINGLTNLGNKKEATKEFTSLERFTTALSTKLDDFTNALEIAQRTGEEQITSYKRLGKEFDPKDKTRRSEDNKDNNFIVHKNSGRIIDVMAGEVAVLQSSVNQARNMITPAKTDEVTQPPVRSTEEGVATETDITNPNTNPNTEEEVNTPTSVIPETSTNSKGEVRGKAKDALASVISEDSYSAGIKQVAQVIHDSIDENIEVIYVAPDSEHLVVRSTGGSHPGMHEISPEGKQVVYMSNTLRGESHNETLLHELVHAVLVPVAKVGGIKTKEEKIFITRMTTLLNRMRKEAKAKGVDKDPAIKYGLENVDEFLAMSFSNPEFVQFMIDTPVGKRTLFSLFAEMVAKFIGLDTSQYSAFEKILDISAPVLNTESLTPLVKDTTAEQVDDTFVLDDTAPEPEYDDSFSGEPIDTSYYDSLDTQDFSESLSIDDIQQDVPVFDQEVIEQEEEIIAVDVDKSLDNKDLEYKSDEDPTYDSTYNMAQGITSGETEPRPSKEELVNTPGLITKWYKSVDLLSAMFRPSNGNTEDLGILHTQNNLFQRLSEQGTGIVRNFLGRGLTNGERNNLNAMSAFDKGIQDNILKVMGTVNKGFGYKNLSSFLIKEGEIDPNVVSSISTTLYNFVATRVSDTLINDESDLKSILSKPDHHIFTPAELDLAREQFGLVGSVRSRVANDLGQKVYKALGISSDGKAFKNLDPQLEQALGQLAINLLIDQGYVTESNENLQVLSAPGTANVRQTTRFIRVNVESGIDPVTGLQNKEVVAGNVKGVVDANKEASKLSTELFNTKSYKVTPSLTPIKDVVKTMKGSIQKVPKRIQKILAKKQSEKHFVKQDALDVVDFLGTGTLARILGFKTEEDIAKLHVTNRKGAEGSNMQASRSIENMIDLINELDGDTSKAIYFGNFVAKQLRNHLDSNTVNPQTDKFHRFMVAHGNQIVDIPFGSKGDSRLFWVAAEFLGIDTDAQVRKLLEDPDNAITKAVGSMVNVLNKEGTEADKEIIEAGVIAGKHKAQSLDVIMALAKRKIALDAGLSVYPSNISEEIDGKTNGVIIGLLQLSSGVITPAELMKKLNKGGFFSKEDGHTTIETWKSPTNFDAYEEIARVWQHAIDYAKTPAFNKRDPKRKGGPQPTQVTYNQVIAMQLIFGTLTEKDENGVERITGRSLAKNPLMVSVYGSGDISVKDALIASFITEFHNKVEATVNDKTLSAADKNTKLLELDLAVTTIAGRRLYNMPTSSSKALTDMKISDPKDISDIIDAVYGDGLISAINVEYADFKETRREVNSAMKVAHTIHQTMYNTLYERILNDFHNRGIIDKNIMDLPKDTIKRIEKEVEGALPRMHNYFSKQEGTHDSAINTQKISEKQESTKSSYLVETNKTEDSKRIDTYGYTSQTETPGVAPAIMNIHGSDAATIYLLHEVMKVIGVHDAALFSLLETVEGAQKFNEVFLEVMKGISFTQEASRTLHKANETLTRFDKLYETDVRSEVAESLHLDAVISSPTGAFADFVPDDAVVSVDQALYRVDQASKQATSNKDKVLENVESMDQYHLLGGGGEFKVTNKDTLTPSEEAAAVTTEAFIQDLVEELRKDTLGSSQEAQDIDIENFNPDETLRVDSLNTLEVFESLEQHNVITEDAGHQNYLRDLLKNIVGSSMSAFDLHIGTSRRDIENVGATTGDNMYIETLKGNSTFSSGMLAQGLLMSAQEVYVHEIIHNITKQGIKVDLIGRKELIRLFRHAKANLDYKAFLNDPTIDVTDPAHADEVSAAQARYSYVFTPVTEANGSSVHLDEFLTHAVTNKNFGKALSELKLPKAEGLFKELKGKNLYEGAVVIFNRLLTYLITAATGTRTTGNQKEALTALAKRFADIDREHKSLVMRGVDMSGMAVNYAVGKVFGAVVYSARKLATVDFIANSKLPLGVGSILRSTSNIIQATDTTAKDAAKGDFAEVFSGITGVLDKVKYGLAKATITEAKGLTKENAVFHRLARLRNNFVDRSRKHVSTVIKRLVRESFQNDLSDEHSTALYKGVMKTDVASIVSTYGYAKVKSFYNDEVVLDAEIKALNTQLDSYRGYGVFFNNAAESMGHQMVTGKALVEHHLMNAYNVSRTTLDGKPVVSEALKPVAELAIDKLATLYAIKYTSAQTKAAVSELMGTQESGVTMILNLHNELKKEAMERLFDNNPRLFIKGYVKETFNANKSMVVASLDKEKELIKQGYIRQSTNPIKRDSTDPVQDDLYVFINPQGGLSTYLRGIVSFTSKVAKGTNATKIQEQLENDVPYTTGAINNKRTMALKERAIRHMANVRLNKSKAVKENYMVPVINMDGSTKGYRYMMSEHSKDTYLEKNNHVDTALGVLGGNMVDKVASTKYNEQTIDALYTQYKEDFHKRPDAYVEISASSSDPRMKEIWQLMPSETRQYVKDVFGSEGILIREDLVDLVFGQRKLSITDSFDKKEEERNMVEKVIVNVATTFMGAKAAGKLRFAEDWVQQIVGELKQNIIIKTFFVTVSNAISNSMYLKMAGMSASNIVKYQAEAYTQAFIYQEDVAEMDSLEIKISSNPAKFDTKENRERVAELRDAIVNNPVTELMEAGVLQTVVEDAQLEDLDYTSSKGLIDKLDEKTQWVNPTIKNGVKQLIITKDTKLFKVLNNAALLSDFASRYALYKHYTQDATGDQKFSKEDAIARVVDEFVNFDLPTHKFIQYLNDMGLAWFTKWPVRIQKVLAYRLVETPVPVLAALVMVGLTGAPTPYDGAYFINRNPLSALGTPLTGFGSLDNTITMEAVESLLPL